MLQFTVEVVAAAAVPLCSGGRCPGPAGPGGTFLAAEQQECAAGKGRLSHCGLFSPLLQCWGRRRAGALVCYQSSTEQVELVIFFIYYICCFSCTILKVIYVLIKVKSILMLPQVCKYQLCGVHGGPGGDGPADSGGSTTSLQHRAPAARPVCVPEAPAARGARTVSSLHPAGTECGIRLPGVGGADGVCPRHLHRLHGLRIHSASIPLPGRLQRGELRSLPHHQHRHAVCSEREEPQVVTVCPYQCSKSTLTCHCVPNLKKRAAF